MVDVFINFKINNGGCVYKFKMNNGGCVYKF